MYDIGRRLLILAGITLVALLPRTAQAWVETSTQSHLTTLDIEKNGNAVVAHEIILKVRGGPLRSYELDGIDSDAELLPDASVSPAESGRAGSQVYPLLLDKREDNTLKMEVDSPKGLSRGTFVFKLRYKTKLLERHMIRAVGSDVEVRWVAPRAPDGIDSARVVFRLPQASSPPRLPELESRAGGSRSGGRSGRCVHLQRASGGGQGRAGGHASPRCEGRAGGVASGGECPCVRRLRSEHPGRVAELPGPAGDSPGTPGLGSRACGGGLRVRPARAPQVAGREPGREGAGRSSSSAHPHHCAASRVPRGHRARRGSGPGASAERGNVRRRAFGAGDGAGELHRSCSRAHAASAGSLARALGRRCVERTRATATRELARRGNAAGILFLRARPRSIRCRGRVGVSAIALRCDAPRARLGVALARVLHGSLRRASSRSRATSRSSFSSGSPSTCGKIARCVRWRGRGSRSAIPSPTSFDCSSCPAVHSPGCWRSSSVSNISRASAGRWLCRTCWFELRTARRPTPFFLARWCGRAVASKRNAFRCFGPSFRRARCACRSCAPSRAPSRIPAPGPPEGAVRRSSCPSPRARALRRRNRRPSRRLPRRRKKRAAHDAPRARALRDRRTPRRLRLDGR